MNNMHNFILVNCDTDSISFCKPDHSAFTEEEQENLLSELNYLYPSTVRWEHDGLYRKVIVVMAKNYILQTEDGKVKIKGSALKVTQKEPALKEFINKMIEMILNDQTNYSDLYESYVDEIMNMKDIHRWSSRKTISKTTLESERSNEVSIVDAIQGTEYGEGDRVYLYYDIDGQTLKLAEKFDGNYSRKRLLKKLYDNAQVFEPILPVEELFPNYALVKKYKLLHERFQNVPDWKQNKG